MTVPATDGHLVTGPKRHRPGAHDLPAVVAVDADKPPLMVNVRGHGPGIHAVDQGGGLPVRGVEPIALFVVSFRQPDKVHTHPVPVVAGQTLGGGDLPGQSMLKRINSTGMTISIGVVTDWLSSTAVAEPMPSVAPAV